MNKKYLSVFFLLFYIIGFGQDFEFTAKASKTVLGLNQRVKVEYTVNQNGADDFSPPEFKGFKIVAGPSTSVSQSWINGKSSYSQSYIYFLQPVSKGTYTISGAEIIFQGKPLRSNSLTFTITESVEEEKEDGNVENAAQQNIFLAAHVSKENPYVGEGIYVEYRLYFSNKIEFNNPQFGEMPKYEGFWNQEIPLTNYERQIGDYKGEKFNFFTLKKTVLIPQKSGKLIIEPIEMDVVVGVPTGKFDFFGYPLLQRVNQHYTSGARTVNVKALPENGKPIDFSGAVGDYKFMVKATKNQLGLNESANVDIVVNGIGNLKLFELPALKTPSELEVYSPERHERVNTTLEGLSGSVTDTYAIVANYEGKYVIPPVVFSFFNPKIGKYMTMTSDEIIMEVIPGNAADTVISQNTVKQKVQLKGSDFRYINTTTILKPITSTEFYGSWKHIGLLGLPFFLIPFFIVIGNKQKAKRADFKGNRIREATKMSKKYLSEARKNLGNKELFYESLEKALHNFLKAKLNIETSDISSERIASLLREKSVSQVSIVNFLEVLHECNLARFTPIVKGAMEGELDKAAQVIYHVNNELK